MICIPLSLTFPQCMIQAEGPFWVVMLIMDGTDTTEGDRF